ncbi:MAG: Trk system potassium transporter TrkA [Thermoplasmatota archaeon]
MYIIVGGAGEVGFHVARALRDEGHDLAVIEPDPQRLERLGDLDVLSIQGNIASKKVLEEANVEHADLLIACTGRDEVNMVAAALGKTYGLRTIARINETEYLNVPYSKDYAGMGIDVAVSPEMVAAIRIKRLLNQPDLINADVFAQGKVFIAEGRVTEDAFVVGKKVGDVEPPANFIMFAMYRGDDVLIPKPSTRFQAHDRLLMAMPSQETMADVEPYIGRMRPAESDRDVRRVMIAGATRIGIHLARLLEQSKREVVLMDADEERCRKAGEKLEKTLVVHGDVTDRDLLIQENVDTFDAFVGCTRVEEYNVLAALMAKQLGVDMTVAVINQPELKQFLETLDIDLAVAPRLSTVGAILKHVHADDEELSLQNTGEERIIQLRVHEGSPIAGRSIRKAGLPNHSIIAAVVRGEEVILPRGEDRIQPGDHVVAYALSEAVTKLEKLFR